MEAFKFPHVSDPFSNAYVALFRGVENSETLRKRLVAAAKAEGIDGEEEREALNFAFIEARLITSRLHLQTAIYQAILAASQGTLRTKTVHSEVLWALNPTNNISEAIRRYGVSDTSTALFLVRIGGSELSADVVEKNMKLAVKGRLVSLSELEGLTDWATVKKYHKLNGDAAIKEIKDDPKGNCALVDNIIVTTAAMKSVMA